MRKLRWNTELEAIARDADVERAEQARKPRWTEDARLRADHHPLAVWGALAMMCLGGGGAHHEDD